MSVEFIKREKELVLVCESLWRNRLARSAVNRKVGGSNPPRDDYFVLIDCY